MRLYDSVLQIPGICCGDTAMPYALLKLNCHTWTCFRGNPHTPAVDCWCHANAAALDGWRNPNSPALDGRRYTNAATLHSW